MNRGLKKLKEMWDEKPAETIIVISTLLYTGAKLIDAVGSAQSRHAYNQQVKINKIRAGL